MAIRKIAQDFKYNYNSGDAAKVGALYSEDATCRPQLQPSELQSAGGGEFIQLPASSGLCNGWTLRRTCIIAEQ